MNHVQESNNNILTITIRNLKFKLAIRQTVKSCDNCEVPKKIEIRNRKISKNKILEVKYVLKFVEVKETHTVHLNLNCESLDENETWLIS